MAGSTRHLPFCDNEARRAMVRDHAILQGIDYLEVITEPPVDNQRVLEVHFIPKNSTEGRQSLEELLTFLDGRPDLVRVEGGTRIQNIEVLAVERQGEHINVRVDPYGDFSTYTLSLERVADTNDPPRFALDPIYGRCDFSFKAGCPSRFDCQPEVICPPEQYRDVLIDYMAKDYASFRQALFDLIPTKIPDWNETHAADLLVTLAELLAYTGDEISYYQDAVANEAYLDSSRQRISVRRHARLIDYTMHDGSSGRTFMHFTLANNANGFLQAGTQLLSRILVPLETYQPPHGPVLDSAVADLALNATGAVFETVTPALLDSRLNEISIYSWGNQECCLPRGATSVDLPGDLAYDSQRDAPGGDREEFWRLKPGDYLLFVEIRSPTTGLEADADPAHRQVVRLLTVEHTSDPLLNQELTRITWGEADALTFPLCVSAVIEGTYQEVSRARGNLVLADHGRRLTEWHPGDPGAGPEQSGIVLRNRAYRFHLSEGPLSFRLHLPRENAGTMSPAADLFEVDPHRARPQVCLEVQTQTETLAGWEPVTHLLDSGPFERAFAVETDNQGRAMLRFGADEFGMAPPDDSFIQATYRVGVGTDGNVGADTLVHMLPPPETAPCASLYEAPPAPAFPTGVAHAPIDVSDIESVTNPLPAWGGLAPESIEHVKQLAPSAFHAEQFRAVTEEDYARAAEKHPEVDKAVATFRWTGSWHTVFLSIDAQGQTDLPEDLERRVRDWVTRYTLAGYDLEIQPPIYVPLDLEIDICVAPEYFRSDIEEVLMDELSNRDLPDNRRGFFHPDQFTFNQRLYLSALYSVIEAVEGVDSATVRRFRRLYEPDPEPDRPTTQRNKDRGYIECARLEVLRLDNDRSFPENGVLQLNMLGGR